MRVRASIVLAGISAVALSAQQQPPAPTFRSGRDVLTVSASVTDSGGRPLSDLQPSDFEVRVDGQPRAVVTARLYATRGTPGPAAPTAARFTRVADVDPGRAVVVVVDRMSIRSGAEKAAIETAASFVEALATADAVAALAVPERGMEFTRDHAAVAAAIRRMTGARPPTDWTHFMTWDEALAFERGDQTTIATVLERECSPSRDPQAQMHCPQDLQTQWREMLGMGRGQAETILSSLGGLLDRLAAIRAPKHIVLVSGGLPIDPTLLSRYRMLADSAARGHVALSIVQLEQAASDASDRKVSTTVFGGRDQTTGLSTIASTTGGAFYYGIARATGVFDRIAAEVTSVYELGVEGRPSDDDGKLHTVDVKVTRPGTRVRAPAATAAPLKNARSEGIESALAQPTDVSDLPLEIATYMTHSTDPEKVRMILAARLSDASVPSPSDWGYVVTDGSGRVVAGSRTHVDQAAAAPWTAAANVDLPSGQYRLRVAAAGVDGRMAVMEIPLRVGLRAAGSAFASDVIVGAVEGGRVQPRATLRQDERALGMIELSSSEPLTDPRGELVVTRSGANEPVWRGRLKFSTRADDKSVLIGEAAVDLSALPAGAYVASALIERDGATAARVSRMFDVAPGTAAIAPAPVAVPAAPPSPAPPASTARRDPAVDDLMGKVGQYVANFGERASVIVGVERYEQNNRDAALGEPSERHLVAEIALVKTSDAIGWVSYRDVIEVDGKPVGDRQARLQALLLAGTPDMREARRIADESARFNIGPTRRNFNDPTAALFFFASQNQSRFTFSSKGTETTQGRPVLRIDFKETSHPTIIRTADGRDVPTTGSLWVVPDDGTIVRTRVEVRGFDAFGSRSAIDVDFARDSRLGLWLPVKMTERHEGTSRSVQSRSTGLMRGAKPEVVNGIATYADFKRFETAATFTIK